MNIAATMAAVSAADLLGPARLGDASRPLGAAAGAILLAALWPVLAVGALAVPPFLLLAIAFAGGFLVLAAHRRSSGRPAGSLFAAPAPRMAAGLLGLIGSHVLWLLALRCVFPGAAASTLVPWWVVDAMLGGAPAVGPGVAWFLALGGALCWIAFVRTQRCRALGRTPSMGRLCAIAAPICLLLHLCLEPRLPLDAASLLAAVGLGLGPIGIAWLLWDAAQRRGAVSAAPRRGAAGR